MLLKKSGYDVRHGGIDDIPPLIKMGKLMRDESPRFRMMDYDEQKCEVLCQALVNQGGLFIAERDGEPVGMVLGAVTPHFFGNDLMASDFVVYIHPDHRGGSLVVRMLKKFEAWAFSLGAKVVSFGVSTEIDAERTIELYKRLGYRVTGAIAVKER